MRPVYWRRIAAAAVIVLALGATAYLALRPSAAPRDTVRHFGGEAMPGSNKATLTLGDGSLLDLTDAQNGQLAAQGGSNAIKTDAGVLAYQQGAGSGMCNITSSAPRAAGSTASPCQTVRWFG